MVNKFFIKNVVQSIYISSGASRYTLDFFTAKFAKIEIVTLKNSFIYELASSFFIYLFCGLPSILLFSFERRRSKIFSKKSKGCYANMNKYLWKMLNLFIIVGNNKVVAYNSYWLISKQGFCLNYKKPYYLSPLWNINLDYHRVLSVISINLIILVFFKLSKKSVSKFFFKLII